MGEAADGVTYSKQHPVFPHSEAGRQCGRKPLPLPGPATGTLVRGGQPELQGGLELTCVACGHGCQPGCRPHGSSLEGTVLFFPELAAFTLQGQPEVGGVLFGSS